VQKERSTEKKQPSRLRSGREVPCRFRPASTIFRKLGPNVAKERAGVVLDHPNDPRVTIHSAYISESFVKHLVYRATPAALQHLATQ
jgi:hypothetical protein